MATSTENMNKLIQYIKNELYKFNMILDMDINNTDIVINVKKNTNIGYEKGYISLIINNVFITTNSITLTPFSVIFYQNFNCIACVNYDNIEKLGI